MLEGPGGNADDSQSNTNFFFFFFFSSSTCLLPCRSADPPTGSASSPQPLMREASVFGSDR